MMGDVWWSKMNGGICMMMVMGDGLKMINGGCWKVGEITWMRGYD